ncbi:MAG: glycoside hydrolase family 15 protein [Verrucomicrobia bacterium]|nr:glycoside hydrolase family 15 protein [Verrucomicrobiota bacterium]
MPRDIPVGNGNLLVSFDKGGILREFYFPHVGQESHTKGEPFRFGVWVDGNFSWIPDGWNVSRNYLGDTLVTDVRFEQAELQLKITVHDVVDFIENIYLKKIEVENLSGDERDIRLFFGQDFHIYGHEIGDTAAYRPEVRSLLHYKGERYFLINIFANKKYGIDRYAAGNKEIEGSEGTWRDAEDGVLSGNPIAQGSVDSVAEIPMRLKGREKDACFYWIAAGRNWEEVKALNEIVMRKGPEEILRRTTAYWKLWVDKEKLNYALLPEKIAALYRRSLLICRTQINNTGSIIAANDSDVVQFNRDTYSYMWPRDASLIAYAFSIAGHDTAGEFFFLCSKIIEKEGFFLHKYTPAGSLASSWHPWIRGNKSQLPIQEDETALVLWSLWKHYEKVKDIELIRLLYKPLIRRAADFMMEYRDLKTGLPLPSYDLWEERQGVLTFTCAAVYGGLMSAANFAEAFGDTEEAKEYREGALAIRKGMDERLYMPDQKRFARMIDTSGQIDPSIDASLYAIFAFGPYPADDEKVRSTMEQVIDKLWVKTDVGGLARYENDPYYRVENYDNPWFITTLWLAQYYIARAKNKEDLNKALEIFNWVAEHALPSGVMPEQVHPTSGEPLSVSPLTWSHGAFIGAVQEYLNKFLTLDRCPTCKQPAHSKYRAHA